MAEDAIEDRHFQFIESTVLEDFNDSSEIIGAKNARGCVTLNQSGIGIEDHL